MHKIVYCFMRPFTQTLHNRNKKKTTYSKHLMYEVPEQVILLILGGYIF